MALRWTAAAMFEASKGFRRLKAYKQLPMLRAALISRSEQTSNQLHDRTLDEQLKVAYCGRFDVRERQTQTKHQSVYAGSRLKSVDAWEGAALHASLPAVSVKTRRTE
jgi:hypothetical protein